MPAWNSAAPPGVKVQGVAIALRKALALLGATLSCQRHHVDRFLGPSLLAIRSHAVTFNALVPMRTSTHLIGRTPRADTICLTGLHIPGA
jgi:hypothetical protein